jgi:1,4-dihydroxy-2-naphthoate octaprenyltransferase
MLKTIVMTMRPPFLILTVTSLLLAVGWANYQAQDWSGAILFLISIGAIAAHISVNMLNEYEDFHSGLDDLTDRTPFSGGSGGLQQNPAAENWVGTIAYVLIGVVVSIGVFFIYIRGWDILPIGLLGLIIMLSYTSWITKHPWLCLLSSGLAFGPLMVLGSYFVLTGKFDFVLFLLSIVPFLLVNNLLLLNQIPDEQADKKVGRFNFVHLVGIEKTLTFYKLNGIVALLLALGLILSGNLPFSSIIVMLSILIFVPLWLSLQYSNQQINNLSRGLGLSVAFTLVTPLLLASGLFIEPLI